eukprot:3603684-Prymnesium_polylepis.1
MSCAARVAEMKERLSTAWRASIARAPCSSGSNDATDGGRSISATEASLRRSSSTRYTAPESTYQALDRRVAVRPG